MNRWVAAVRSEELVGGHVAIAWLGEIELALWRAASGQPNAWENRCPHRGMRLTLGTNTGDSLVCRYHGWRFSAGTGACSFIPAHPRQIAPKAAAVRTYASCEKYGFVWVGLGAVAGEPQIPGIAGDPHLTFRSVLFHAPLAAVREALLRDAGAVALDAHCIRGQAQRDAAALRAVYLLAPHRQDATLVHGFAAAAVPDAARVALLRQQNAYLTTLREALEPERRTPVAR